MHLDEKSVRRIIDDVWSLVLNASTQDCPEATDDESAFVGSVDVSGAWEGAVAVRCSRTLARLITARTHRLKGAEPTEEQMQFTLAEITSLIGVNVQGLLGSAAVVSRAVVEACEAGPAADTADAASTTWRSSLGHPFAVTVSLRARAA
jgi:hypothetical protein